jgi:uncharacterized membrane protein (DUF106 family)
MAEKGPAGAPSDAKAPEPQKPKRGSFLTILSFAFVFLILFNASIRDALGRYVGYAMDPVFGFGGRYPVLTILLAGTLMVLLTTLMRHFTTDWLEQAKFQSYMRAFNKEFMQARKDNNTYKIKKLQDRQADVMRESQKMQSKQLKNMPLTMIIVIPLFAWMYLFLTELDYWWYSAPWNATVDMFETTVFPHWVLLYMTLSIPLGALVQKAMKYASWKERWARRHPEVHE